NLDKVDSINRYFKISRNIIDQSFYKSVKESGILEMPVLKKEEGKFVVIFGHNRIDYLRKLGFKHVNTVVVNEILPDDYIDYIKLKCYRNEIGPVGKVKLLSILRDHFNIEDGRLLREGSRGLDVPEGIILNSIDRVIALPQNLKDYLDIRDIGFKIIRDLLSLPQKVLDIVSLWVDYSYMRVNVFKRIISMISDIFQRDGTIENILAVELKEIDDSRGKEEYILEQLYRIRYPQYSSMKNGADEIVKLFSREGVAVEYPDYLQGSMIKLSVNLQRGDNMNKLREKINKFDDERILELIKML
ncbi:hypothetical protein ACFL20_08985, partial [Spirochaetota bacterium]